ncbi:MAG: AAA family ATPase, partial [Gammaproteobacteria bacterium]|nr:AAA family ATPase [Gammaproteobacteria bacterium]
MPQLDRLGLRENPFKKSRDHRYFYADQNRAQILESTEHLIDYSSNFQVIIGESGVGKSHLLETLANRIDNNWRIAKVNNAEQYDTLSLIQAILDAFGAIHGGHAELLEALETQLAEINQLGFKPVLLVDSEQALSIDALRFLIQLTQQQQNEEPYINIVLFATAEITELLQSSELSDFREIIHIATLNRFDKEGVSGYLRHKMAVAGYDRESPFTPRIIDSIFNDSKGLPEKINFFADKFLASSGKAENYIEPDADNQTIKMDNSSTADLNKRMDEFASTREHDDFYQEQNDNFMDSLSDDELQTHRSDRAEEQLSRLAEKFEEIEQLGEQPADSLFADSDQHSGDQQSRDFTYDDESSTSVLPKFIIPMAVMGILLIAVLVLNSVFEKSEQAASQLAGKEKIELLPLELPPQDSVSSQQDLDTEKTLQSVN